MKILSKALYALCFVFCLTIIYSCEKNNIEDNLEVAVDSNSSLSSIRVSVEDGILHFQGDEEYFNELDLINNASAEELDAWENKIGFQSQRSAVADIMETALSLTDQNELNTLVRDNNNLVVDTEDGIQAKISHPLYQSLIGKGGIFYVGNSLFKVYPDKVVEIVDGDLNKIEGTETLQESQGENILVYNFEQTSSLRWCTATYAYKQVGNRKVHLDMYTNVTSCGCGTYRVVVATKVWGQKRSWGRWRNYRTSLRFECGAYTVDINGAKFSSSNWSAQTSNDAYTLTRGRYLGQIYYQPPSANFDTAKSRAKSRGVDNNWAVICCGFGSSCPSATGGYGLCN